MALTRTLSRGNWGRPISFTDGVDTVRVSLTDDRQLVWPQMSPPNPPVEILAVHPTPGDGRTIPLMVTFDPHPPVDVIPAKWQEWVEAGLITDELLSDVPQPPPTEEELAEQLTAAKVARQAQLDARWEEQCVAGLPVSASNISTRVGCRESDVALFTGQQVLAERAVQFGVATADGPFTILDLSGTSYDFTLQELTIFLLTYGQARATLARQYGSAKVDINAATTIDDVNAVALPSVI